jgi:hypothetical protein
MLKANHFLLQPRCALALTIDFVIGTIPAFRIHASLFAIDSNEHGADGARAGCSSSIPDGPRADARAASIGCSATSTNSDAS